MVTSLEKLHCIQFRSTSQQFTLASPTDLTPVSPGCLLIVFKGHFSPAESQHVLFIPLSQPVKRMLCKKHPKELNVIKPHDAGEWLSHRALTHSSCKSEYNALSTTLSLRLAKLFHQMTYLRGQQYFPVGLILPASLSHLNHCQPFSHNCNLV